MGYDGLWSLYRTTDVRPNGTIWDMYSTKEWRYGSEQCGNYDYVGDCYNREHSMPKNSPGKSTAQDGPEDAHRRAREDTFHWHTPRKDSWVRNDAVYARQHNRNPFIDHPEMVEYIWGDRKEQRWTSQGPAEPEFVLPAEGSLVDFGTVAAAVGGSRSLTVRTTGMTAPVEAG